MIETQMLLLLLTYFYAQKLLPIMQEKYIENIE